MLYCVLFHGTISDPNTTSPKDSYAANTIQVAIQSLRFFNSFAVLDLPAFQVKDALKLLLSVEMLIIAYTFGLNFAFKMLVIEGTFTIKCLGFFMLKTANYCYFHCIAMANEFKQKVKIWTMQNAESHPLFLLFKKPHF